jgi:DNA-binding response OmpR family regulator
LLEYLACSKGSRFRRLDLAISTTIGDEAVSNVVDVYIGYLRSKIDRDHETKLIHTRRGMGYVLAESP